MLRDAVLALAAGDTMKSLVTGMPISSGIVRRFVAGETVADVVATAGALAASQAITAEGELELQMPQLRNTADRFVSQVCR